MASIVDMFCRGELTRLVTLKTTPDNSYMLDYGCNALI